MESKMQFMVPSLCLMSADAAHREVERCARVLIVKMSSGESVGDLPLVSIGPIGRVLLQETGDLSELRGVLALEPDLNDDGVWLRLYWLEELRAKLVDLAERQNALSERAVNEALLAEWGGTWWGSLCCGFFVGEGEDVSSVSRRVQLLADSRQTLQLLRYEWGGRMYAFEPLMRRRFGGVLSMWGEDASPDVFGALDVALKRASLASEEERLVQSAGWLAIVAKGREGLRAQPRLSDVDFLRGALALAADEWKASIAAGVEESAIRYLYKLMRE